MTNDPMTDEPNSFTDRMKFSLRSLVLLIAIVAAGFGVLVFYRPHSVAVEYQFATVDGAAVESILSSCEATQVTDSPYFWLILDEGNLATLLQGGNVATRILAQNSRVVSGWPKVADAFTYAAPRTLLLDSETNHQHTDWESGGVAGFLGARKAGSEVQLRIEFDSNFDRPDFKAYPTLDFPRQSCKGKLFYEGELPSNHLVFLAPIDEVSFHAVLFDAD